MTVIWWEIDRSMYPALYHAVMRSGRLCAWKGDIGWDFKHYQPPPASGALGRAVCLDCKVRFDQVLIRNGKPRGKGVSSASAD